MRVITFGTPALIQDGAEISLHNKHLSLLVFLLVETEPHRADFLRELLWRGVDSAAVSLSKALKVVRELVGESSLPPYSKSIRLREKPPMDALRLLEARRRADLRPEALNSYTGPFLSGFVLGSDEQGYAEWNRWVELQRERFERVFLELSSEEAKDRIARKEWERARDVLQRALDRVSSWKEGEKLLAEVVCGREADRAKGRTEPYSPEQLVAGGRPEQPHRQVEEPEPPMAPGENLLKDRRPDELPPDKAGMRSRLLVPALALVLFFASAEMWVQIRASVLRRGTELRQPLNGENVRAPDGATYLVMNRTLYRYPDAETLKACTGGHLSVVRAVDRLPPWRRIVLPSRKTHPWMSGSAPIASDDLRDLTDYALVGCVLAGIPDPLTFQVIFGHRDWDRLIRVPDSIIDNVLPQAAAASAYPLLPAGTLIRGSGNEIRWVVYPGGALGVKNHDILKSHCRDAREVLMVSEHEFGFYLKQADLHQASSACR